MKSIDSLHGKVYDKNKYNCAHFTVDAWKYLFDEDIQEAFRGLLAPLKDNKATLALRKGFKRLQSPINPCIVLFSRSHSTPHVGLYIDGKILHLTEQGVQYVPLCVAGMGFKTRRFYKC